MFSRHLMLWMGLALLTTTPCYGEQQVRAMVGGAAAVTADGAEYLNVSSAGALTHAEFEIYGKPIGFYARAQNNTLLSNFQVDPAELAAVEAVASFERYLFLGPTLGLKVGPARLRFAFGGAALESDLVEGSMAEIESGQGEVVLGAARYYGIATEARLDLTVPVLKPYAAVRLIGTSANPVALGGGSYDLMSQFEQQEIRNSLGSRQRLDAVGGLRFSVLPFLQLGLEGSYGYMASPSTATQTWYGLGLGLHLLM